MKTSFKFNDVARILALLVIFVGVKDHRAVLNQVFPVINTTLAIAIGVETYNITCLYDRRCKISKLLWAYLCTITAVVLVIFDWIYVYNNAWSAITWLEYVYYLIELSFLCLVLAGLHLMSSITSDKRS